MFTERRYFWVQVRMTKQEIQSIADRAGVVIEWDDSHSWRCLDSESEDKLENFCRNILLDTFGYINTAAVR